MDKLLYRPVEAAAVIGVSRARIYELIAQGVIPSVRLGGSTIRVPVEALRQYIDSQLPEGFTSRTEPVDLRELAKALKRFAELAAAPGVSMKEIGTALQEMQLPVK